jgi:hypothetical protein
MEMAREYVREASPKTGLHVLPIVSALPWSLPKTGRRSAQKPSSKLLSNSPTIYATRASIEEIGVVGDEYAMSP